MSVDIVYYSLLGNVRRFMIKTGFIARPIGDFDMFHPFVLVTNTVLRGAVPLSVDTFLERNGDVLVGAAASGNRNWGEHFARAADVISEQYGVPILHKFELSGTDEDVRIFMERMREIAKSYRTEQ